jgi:hypothetical protein
LNYLCGVGIKYIINENDVLDIVADIEGPGKNSIIILKIN